MQHNDANTEPIFVVKLTGTLSPEDIERYERELKKQLRGRVILTDKQVPAKVLPVAMSSDELLVERQDGTLGTARLWDIRMEVKKNADNCS